jgi:hypothetical protein
MKRIASLITLLTLAFILVFTPVANAATTGTVTATVTVQSVSVSVTDGTVAYGTLGVNSSAGTNGTDTQTATNNGNVAEDLNIKGQNTANWTLAATAASDQYVHKFCVASCGSAPTNFTALTTSYQALASNIGASATQTFDLYLTTPTVSTNFSQQSVDIVVQAVAH